MTDQQYDNWLADLSAARVVLAELHHAQGVEYVATAPFISRPTDADPNRPYDDILESAVDITTRIDGLVGFGEIALLDDGRITPWAGYAWEGHRIYLYLGGPDWPRDDFRLLAQGRNRGITNAQRGTLALAMEDESSIFETPIDTGELPDDAGPVPLALGSIYNAPAYLLQPDPFEFKASYLAVTSLTPKDNGNPIPHTDNLANGSFELSSGLVGTLTVDIEEPHNTPALICQWVASQYGITVASIDLPAYTVGLYYNDTVSGRQILDELCQGLGAYWYLNATNQLVVRQHAEPTSPELTLLSDDILRDQIRLSETEPPWASLTLRWRRNYQTLSTVAGAVPKAEAARLKESWRETRGTQALPDYPLADSVERNSVIQTAADAATEHARLMTLRSTRREIWSIGAFLLPAKEGMTLAVDHPRLAGRASRIISVSRSPTRGVTNLEVWL